MDFRKRLKANEAGATAIEYALIAALIAVAGVVAFTATGTTINESFINITDGFCAAVGGTFSTDEGGTGSCTFS
ncbi:Flp family type IVb pilin [Sneathiella chinensis]|uniref:Flp family type IVb pilin n=1 Tax=Sneathiella chinensis TaxID=349750 RepID=A0ABQ5U324_9PROT|nr:Flp family type IVb pilin [Sneathiella chinensis]GLQ06559.1 hypothetical protein GCM10007924_17800 [Sneathiella chinensis]